MRKSRFGKFAALPAIFAGGLLVSGIAAATSQANAGVLLQNAKVTNTKAGAVLQRREDSRLNNLFRRKGPHPDG